MPKIQNNEIERRVELVEMHADINLIKTELENCNESTEKILTILQGNGKEGLVTGFALLKQSMGRVWWFIGGIAMAILLGAIWIIRMGLTH